MDFWFSLTLQISYKCCQSEKSVLSPMSRAKSYQAVSRLPVSRMTLGQKGPWGALRSTYYYGQGI